MSTAAKFVLLVLCLVAGFAGGIKYEHGVIAQRDLEISKQQLRESEKNTDRLQARDDLLAKSEGKKNAEIRAINARLVDALGELHNRPERSQQSAADCKGTTGAELSRPDAGFLIREAARADTLRSALAQCYRDYDALTQ